MSRWRHFFAHFSSFKKIYIFSPKTYSSHDTQPTKRGRSDTGKNTERTVQEMGFTNFSHALLMQRALNSWLKSPAETLQLSANGTCQFWKVVLLSNIAATALHRVLTPKDKWVHKTKHKQAGQHIAIMCHIREYISQWMKLPVISVNIKVLNFKDN